MTATREFEFIIQWHLTERCNLRCSHCYQEGARTEELSLVEVLSALNELGELFPAWSEAYGLQFAPSFNITGGEPLLRSDIHDILSAVAWHGWDAFLLTNATLISAARAVRLADSGIKGVQVSLEGPEVLHDSLRGAGSFAASISGIRALLQAGLVVTVNTTLSELNADAFFELAETAAHLGVQRLGFSRLVPYGRGANLAARMLTRERIRDLYQRIFSLPYENMKVVTGDPIAASIRAEKEAADDHGDIPIGGCAAGVSGLTFLSDGTIVPCRRLPIPLGNIRSDAIREVWAASPVLDWFRTRSRYKGKCGACRRWAVCRGCRAIASAVSRHNSTGMYLDDDPQCPLK